MICEYLWLDSNLHLRSKLRNISFSCDIHSFFHKYQTQYVSCYNNDKVDIIKKIPIWN